VRHTDLKVLLDQQVQRFNQPTFIENDPILIPHRYTQLQDIEITAFWVSMLAWGQRKTIINKATTLFELMDNTPYQFILGHEEKDRTRFLNFKHRTFQTTDVLYFLDFLQSFYRQHSSLETAFVCESLTQSSTVEPALLHFHRLFFSLPHAPQRTQKHIATPERKSTCKRLNMFLRWMVRQDSHGVDFGVWKSIKPAQLLMPLDVHVDRIARRLGLLERKQTDWLAVLELTERLRQFDPQDPVKYDFALFGMGVLEDY
jgi:uncharacterized protein (TIGR02757 family)